MWLGTGSLLEPVPYVSGSPLIALGLVLLLPSLHRKGWMLRAWWQLHSKGPQVISHELLRQSKDKVVTQSTAHWGKITYIGRADVAKQVFQTSAFVNRLGSEYGLKQLGMYKQGIIWNNTEGWELGRKLFSEGIQGVVKTHEQHVKQVCIAAFKLTFAEQCHTPTSNDNRHSTSPRRRLPSVKRLAGMPLSQLASEVAGLDLDLLPDGRDFLRLVTFRVTTALALGMPVYAFNGQDALEMVRKVAAYFKAWEYFFLRPAWLCYLTRWTDKHKHHLQAIQDLQCASRALIRQATAYSQQAASNTLGNNTCSSDVAFQSTFLGKVLAEQAKGHVNSSQVQQLVLEMLLAGTDTSSVSLYYLMVELQGNRALEDKLRDEVLAAAGNISNLNDEQLAQQLEVTAGFDPRLPKCQSALCEAMRYKPVGPVVIRQAVQPVTLTYTTAGAAAGSTQQHQKQLFLNTGDTVIISLETMHRDPKVFPAPDQFCPFTNIKDTSGDSSSSSLAVSAEQPPAATAAVTSGGNVSFRPFGRGEKGCVGQELGWMEMKMILVCWQLTMQFRSPSEGSTAAAAVATAAAAAADNSASNSSSGPSKGSSSHRSLLDQMTTKWEVASQPTNPISLHLRCVHVSDSGLAGTVERVYVVGAHGSGKTTLCRSLMRQLTGGCDDEAVCTAAQTHSSFGGSAAAESAPAGEDSGHQQQQLSVEESSLDVAVKAPAASVVSVTANATTTGGPDPAFSLISETARRVMADNGICRDMLAHPNEFLRLQHLIIQRQLETENSLGSGRFISDRCVVDALAYTADRFGILSQEVADLLALPATQELLQKCRAPGSLVLLLPPFHAGPPADDGVRLMTDTAKLTAMFEIVLQQQSVPFRVMSAVSQRERVHELLRLAGL